MITGIIKATGFAGPLIGVVNGVALRTTGPATDFLNAVGAYSIPQGEVPAARNLAAGSGLVGGGNLSANRTFAVGVISDTQHGTRGGGGLHSDVVAGSASGFMTGTQATKLVGIQALANVTNTANVTTAGALMRTGGTMSGDLRMVQNTRVRFTGGGGSFTNYLEGNVANTGRLSLFTSNVERLSISLGGIVIIRSPAVLVATGLKSGTLAAPPGGLASGEFWEDTTDSAAQRIVRIAA